MHTFITSSNLQTQKEMESTQILKCNEVKNCCRAVAALDPIKIISSTYTSTNIKSFPDLLTNKLVSLLVLMKAQFSKHFCSL